MIKNQKLKNLRDKIDKARERQEENKRRKIFCG